MPDIYKGNTPIPAGNLNIGGSPVQFVYRGSQIIWPAIPPTLTELGALVQVTGDTTNGLGFTFPARTPGSILIGLVSMVENANLTNAQSTLTADGQNVPLVARKTYANSGRTATAAIHALDDDTITGAITVDHVCQYSMHKSVWFLELAASPENPLATPVAIASGEDGNEGDVQCTIPGGSINGQRDTIISVYASRNNAEPALGAMSWSADNNLFDTFVGHPDLSEVRSGWAAGSGVQSQSFLSAVDDSIGGTSSNRCSVIVAANFRVPDP